MCVPGGQLMLVPLEIFSLGLLPWPQLSGATRGLVGDSELDIRLYGLYESSSWGGFPGGPKEADMAPEYGETTVS